MCRGLIAFVLCLGIFNLPVAASAQGEMITTTTVVANLAQDELRANLNAMIERQDVQEQLTKLGVSTDEAKTRLATLSDQELSQLAKQIEGQQAGSSLLGIGLLVLVVILIIYFARRI